MAQLHPFPSEALVAIAAQIPNTASPLLDFSPERSVRVEIGESFPLYSLDGALKLEPGQVLVDLLTDTGQWQHQIRHGTEASAIALSAPQGEDNTKWRVDAVFVSDIAARVADAIAWIDAQGAGIPEGKVSVLVAPAFLLHALWIRAAQGDFIVAVDAPDDFKDLQTPRLCSAEEFLRILAGASRNRGYPPFGE